MKRSFAFAPGRIFATILLCMLLAACSTTQKSATGTGTQEAAPIADAAGSEPGAAGTSGSATGTESPAEVGAVTPNPEMTPEEQAAAAKGDEEAARLQQQLAEQEAEINRLREEQVKAQQLADEEAKRRAADSAAATAPSGSGQDGGGVGQPPAESAAASGSAETPQAPSQAAPAAADAAPSGVQPAPEQPLTRAIYFEYDNATIADEYDSVLVGHAAFLKANPDFKAEVQGNCDSRGSREYNLALGARRAEAVKRALELAGADGSKIKAVSFGAEKPVAFGEDEESYRKNRRADILY